MTNTIYMYPMRNVVDLKQKNPYVYHLCSGLLTKFKIVNYGNDITGGVLDAIKYIFRCKILYFNWIESIPSIQVPFFLMIFLFSKVLNKKIIWTHHNVHPHSSNSAVSKGLMELLIRYADVIVIHTRESLPLLRSRANQKKIVYFFHPFFSEDLQSDIHRSRDKQYDLLIWGNVRKSKGVEQFLSYLKENTLLNTYRIKVIGKFETQEYFQRMVNCYGSSNIDIENVFIRNEELQSYHYQSKFIFFPYTGSSVLNSGALITSLPFGVPIIGPRVGAFKELSEMGYIQSYNSFSDVICYLEKGHINYEIENRLLSNFIQDHTWIKFAEHLNTNIYNSGAIQ